MQVLTGPSWAALRPVMHKLLGCLFYFQLFSSVQLFHGDCTFIYVKHAEVSASWFCCFISLIVVEGEGHSFPVNQRRREVIYLPCAYLKVVVYYEVHHVWAQLLILLHICLIFWSWARESCFCQHCVSSVEAEACLEWPTVSHQLFTVLGAGQSEPGLLKYMKSKLLCKTSLDRAYPI